jgi:DNA-binding MarR family transcriptional regulator
MLGQSRTLQSGTEPVGVMAGLVRALDWFDNGLQNVLASLSYKPLHRTQSMIMVHVASGVESPADIARSMGLSRQNVHHMAKALIADGLIEQSPDPADPRRALYRLAGSAAEIRGAALETLAQLELVLAGRIGPRSLHSLRGALGKDWGDAIAGGEALAAELDGHDVLAN